MTAERKPRRPSLTQALSLLIEKGQKVREVRSNPDGTFTILTGETRTADMDLSPAERWAREHGQSAA